MSEKLGHQATFYDAEVDNYFYDAFQVKECPTIVLVKNGKYYEYNGPRFVENMWEFINYRLYLSSPSNRLPGELGKLSRFCYWMQSLLDENRTGIHA